MLARSISYGAFPKQDLLTEAGQLTRKVQRPELPVASCQRLVANVLASLVGGRSSQKVCMDALAFGVSKARSDRGTEGERCGLHHKQ